MRNRTNPHLIAVLQALLVTFLWSTSWVLVKIGLQDIPALTFAGLRYLLAFLVLLPVYLRSRHATPIARLSSRDWLALIVLGVVYYTITQGTQFLGLVYLPAITFSLLLNFTAVITTLLAIPTLGERPTWLQWAGVLLFMLGVFLYFYPVFIPAGMLVGFGIAAVSILANSVSSILGRSLNRSAHIHPLTVTVVSMGVGSLLLMGAGLLVEGLPRLDLTGWGIVAYLAVVNTAFAFTLWNHTLRTLTAMQSSIINNTMLIQIAVLAWVFLGERISWLETVGLLVVALGAVLVQFRPPAPKPTT